MKIKSLLAAVSMVAITAGTASALSIPTTAAEVAAVVNPNVTTAVVSPTGVVLANELALPAAGLGNIDFSVITDSGDYPSGNNFIVTITPPTGVGIDGPVTGSVLVGPAGGSAVVQNQTATSLQLFVSIPQNAPVGALDFSIPVELTDCAVSGDLTVTIETEGGTPVEDGTASVESPIEPCESAFDTDFDPDADDTTIALADFEQLRNFDGGGLVLFSRVGLFDALIDTSVGVDLAGTALTPASIDEVTFDVCIEDATGIENIYVAGVPGTASADGLTYSFTHTFTADVTDDFITIEVAGDEVITSQNITVKNVLHDFTDAGGPDLIGTEAGTGGALDPLQREGQSFGVFDWNSGPAGAQTVSVYRITGLTPGEDVTYTATLYNSFANGGGAYVLPSATVTGDASGEAAIVSTTLAGIPATIVRYDLGLNFETGNTLDVDRQLLTEGVVSAFNGGANNDTDGVLQGSPTSDNDN